MPSTTWRPGARSYATAAIRSWSATSLAGLHRSSLPTPMAIPSSCSRRHSLAADLDQFSQLLGERLDGLGPAVERGGRILIDGDTPIAVAQRGDECLHGVNGRIQVRF